MHLVVFEENYTSFDAICCYQYRNTQYVIAFEQWRRDVSWWFLTAPSRENFYSRPPVLKMISRHASRMANDSDVGPYNTNDC